MTASTSAERRNTAWIDLLAVAAVAVGVLARLWHLTSFDFWTDEIHTMTIARTGQYVGPAYRLAPINFVLTRWSMHSVGETELGARLVPVIAGILTVCLVYLLGRRWLGQRAALFAAALLAVCPWHVQWSQTARHFSLVTLFALISLHGLAIFWKENRKIGLVVLPVFMALALGVHSSAAFFLAGMLAFVGLHWLVWLKQTYARDRKLIDQRHLYALGALAVVLIAYVPVTMTLGSYLAATTVPWNSLSNLIGSLVFYIPPYLALAALAGAWLMTANGDDLGLLLLSLIVVPVVLIIAASRVTIAGSPYVLASIVPVVMLAGVAFDRLLTLSNSGATRLAIGVVGAGVLFSQLFDLSLYHLKYNGTRARWREAAAFVKAHRQPTDLVVAAEGDVMNYYLQDPTVKWLDGVQAQIDRGTFPPPNSPGIWYVIYTADEPLFASDREARGRIIGSKELRDLLPLNYGPKDRTIGVFYEPPHGVAAQ